MPSVAVSDVAAEGRYLDASISLRGATPGFAVHHQHHAELRSHTVAVRKHAQHFCGDGIGGDIVIRGLALQHKVANASAHEVGFVARGSQFLDRHRPR